MTSRRSLLVEVHLIVGHYHGVGDWPPSPFRLFQALVAGAYGGRWIGEADAARKDEAFRWLEAQAPPIISVPSRALGRPLRYYVPNNDLDAKGGDPARAAEIRVAKDSRASFIAPDEPSLYLWPIDDETHIETICLLSERLHTLGRGIDAAFARAAAIDTEAALDRLATNGRIARPGATGKGEAGLRCPVKGSFDSLVRRHEEQANQLEQLTDQPATLFRQPPKARCGIVQYDQPATKLLFDIRGADDPLKFRPVDQARAVDVAISVRDLAIRRLAGVQPERTTEFEHIVAGRGERPPDASRRPRIVPIPTIGMPDANPGIRRVFVEVPWNCPITVADLEWALSGQILDKLTAVDPATGEIGRERVLVPAEDRGMLEHYGVSDRTRARMWATVTPAALPHPRGSGNGAEDRLRIERQLALSVLNAARHAGLPYQGLSVRVQREPFLGRGAMAGAFAAGRFPASALYHVQITFPEPLAGPVTIGDGRWLGLGLMAPFKEGRPREHVFELSGARWSIDDGVALARAVRRAVLARVGALMPRGVRVSSFFSGHEPGGAPIRRESHGHLFYLVDDRNGDGYLDTICIVAPELADRTAPSSSNRDLAYLRDALTGLTQVLAGREGIIDIAPFVERQHRFFASARLWESVTPYIPTRYPRAAADLPRALSDDLVLECRRRGLPTPAVTILDIMGGRRGAVRGRARLMFDVPVKGPLALGRESHFGQGVFAPAASLQIASALA